MWITTAYPTCWCSVIWILPMQGTNPKCPETSWDLKMTKKNTYQLSTSWFIWSWVFVHPRCENSYISERPRKLPTKSIALAGLVRYLEKSQHAFHCPRREWGLWPFLPGIFVGFSVSFSGGGWHLGTWCVFDVYFYVAKSTLRKFNVAPEKLPSQ